MTDKKYTSEEIKKILLSYSDNKYSEFSSALIPGENSLIGVRLPRLRKLAKEIAKSDYMYYLHYSCNNMVYFEEIMLKGMVIGALQVEDEIFWELVKDFVPLITNWSVNDSFCAGLKRVNKCRAVAWNFIQPYLSCTEEFPLRFGIVMLMDYFFVDEYAENAISIVSSLSHQGYYAKMAMAWFMATAYAKYPKLTIKYFKNCKYDDWTYNKAIQKMLESYRISPEDKVVLRKMKRK